MKKQTPRPPSQSWRTFLSNHMRQTAACDFFLIFTIHYRLLVCFLVLSHDRRRIVHFNVTPNPTSEWTAQQVIEDFPGDGSVPKYLVRDRDAIYGTFFRRRVKGMGIQEVIIARKSPWQNPYVERVIGSIRRECLDHVILLGERHLRRILKEYIGYYNNSRTHLSLQKNSPIPREIESPEKGSRNRNPNGRWIAPPIQAGCVNPQRGRRKVRR
ncbi:MAG: integrase core domain-containing protein [Acidobacteria bacterium]|nr:integrase core domain-containing protein [Acidobacteriota bacterium]